MKASSILAIAFLTMKNTIAMENYYYGNDIESADNFDVSVPDFQRYSGKLVQKKQKKSKGGKNRRPKGVIELDYYKRRANRFVGLNPVSGNGSGFISRESSGTSMKGPTFGDVPESGGGRNNLCTCECKPSDSGIGCAGHAGINFRYSSLLWIDPFTERWTGQMQALQTVTGGELNFYGTDTRFSPGGPAVYNVACTQKDCGDLFAGVFRQYNDRVSCKAALKEDENDTSSCLVRCGESGVYKEWLEYCKAKKDKSRETGFSGYGV